MSSKTFDNDPNPAPQFSKENFHTSLSVGPWLLEWSDQSLCIPKKIFSTKAILALDVDHNLETIDVDRVIDSLSEVVHRWNINHKYDQLNDNCQHFIDDLLISLDIDPHLKFKGQLGNYIQKIRKNGKTDMSMNF